MSAAYKAAPGRRVLQNKHVGAHFEKLLVHRAQLCGLLILRNELSFRYQGGGKMLPIRTDLDFRICNKRGQTAFCDAKSFDQDYFTFSQITEHQLRRARIYEAYNVPAGFVVWFKPSQQVLFYAGNVLHQMGPRSRFTSAHGVSLGHALNFDPRLIFVAPEWAQNKS
ncbi:MAG: hypothetical protein EOO38_00150 [Cytophagaceae bacterium]|nr:MAG: hypothetical protein EOO38_00150 [Cytophagaceae bacterium]